MAIAATRMHRSLVDYAPKSTDVYDVLYSLASSGSSRRGRYLLSTNKNSQNRHLPVQEARRTNATSVPSDRMEVAVHIVSELYETQQTREDSSIGTDEQMHEKLKGLGSYDDVERGM